MGGGAWPWVPKSGMMALEFGCRLAEGRGVGGPVMGLVWTAVKGVCGS